MKETKRKLEIIEAAIHDYKRGVLSELSAIIAIGTLFTDHTPSPEVIKWVNENLEPMGANMPRKAKKK